MKNNHHIYICRQFNSATKNYLSKRKAEKTKKYLLLLPSRGTETNNKGKIFSSSVSVFILILSVLQFVELYQNVSNYVEFCSVLLTICPYYIHIDIVIIHIVSQLSSPRNQYLSNFAPVLDRFLYLRQYLKTFPSCLLFINTFIFVQFELSKNLNIPKVCAVSVHMFTSLKWPGH